MYNYKTNKQTNKKQLEESKDKQIVKCKIF